MKLLFELLAFALFAIAMTIMVMEWFAGCGESYVDHRGVRHVNECLFFNINKE